MSNFEAHHRFARITARKARYVADLVRGADVNRAIEILDGTHKRGSGFVSRVVKSAVANATRDGNTNANRLFIREIQVDAGPLLQGRFRFRPGPMGRALPIRKRTSHIHVVLGERPSTKKGAGSAESTQAAPAETKATKTAAAKSGAAKAAAPKKATKSSAAKKDN